MIKYLVNNFYCAFGTLLLLMLMDRVLTRTTRNISEKTKRKFMELNPAYQESVKTGKLFMPRDILIILAFFFVFFIFFRNPVEESLCIRSYLIGFIYIPFLLINIGHIQNILFIKYELGSEDAKKIGPMLGQISDGYIYDTSIMGSYKYIILFAMLFILKPTAFLLGCIGGCLLQTLSFRAYKRKHLAKNKVL